MGTHTNVIEINGTQYDAVTGVVVKSAAHKPTMVDGIVRRPKDTSAVRPAMHSVKKHHITPQKSATLMRTAVKKPSSLHVSDVQRPKATVVPKAVVGKAVITPRTNAVPVHRQQRAETTQKSEQVKKFSDAVPVVATVMPLEVRPTPINDSTLEFSRPSHMKKADLLEKAMAAAQGHNEPAYQHKKKLHHRSAKKVGISGRAVAITSTVMAGLLIGGFYAYQNVPRLAMRVASSRAGIKANLPAYNPAGFSFNGPVQYSSGQVVVDYKSNIDDREYTLTQQNTAWSSDALLSNFLVNNGKQYQTYQDRGRTIYIYDNNNATWVDGGIWYQIEGHSQLSSDQLVRIASSM